MAVTLTDITDRVKGMEHLWSQAGATSCNRSQNAPARKRLKQADRQPVATHGNRFGAHGKEHVCHRLPAVADDPLLDKEGVTFLAPQREVVRVVVPAEGDTRGLRRLRTPAPARDPAW
jgi:hypothetical protein